MFQEVKAQLEAIKKDMADIKAGGHSNATNMDDLESLFSSLESEGHQSGHQSPPFTHPPFV